MIKSPERVVILRPTEDINALPAQMSHFWRRRRRKRRRRRRRRKKGVEERKGGGQ